MGFEILKKRRVVSAVFDGMMRWTDLDFTLSASSWRGSWRGAVMGRMFFSHRAQERVCGMVSWLQNGTSELVSYGKKNKCQQLSVCVCMCGCVRVWDALRGGALHHKLDIDYTDCQMHGWHQILQPYVHMKEVQSHTQTRTHTHQQLLALHCCWTCPSIL